MPDSIGGLVPRVSEKVSGVSFSLPFLEAYPCAASACFAASTSPGMRCM